MIKKQIIITIYEDVDSLELPQTAAEIAVVDAINTAALQLGYSETEFLPPEIITAKQLLSSETETEVILTGINILSAIGE
jgi:hypothetical protein